jgi:hypothetical protein
MMLRKPTSKNDDTSFSRTCVDSFTIHGSNICSKSIYYRVCISNYIYHEKNSIAEANTNLELCQQLDQGCGRNESIACPLENHLLSLDRILECRSEKHKKQHQLTKLTKMLMPLFS